MISHARDALAAAEPELPDDEVGPPASPSRPHKPRGFP